MKKRLRILTPLLILVILGFAQSAFSLGLGEVTAESALNEPLVARIALLNVADLTEQDIVVGIGSESDYRIAGVNRDYFHTRIELEPHIDGLSDQAYISVITDAPVREPYLNFVVQVRWPQGKLLREYTVLLDLPLFTGKTEPQKISQPQAATSPLAQSRPSTRSIPDTRPAAISTAKPSISGSEYRIKNGDTLWSLAGRVASGAGVTRHQAMLAIRDLNPNAFINGDPNALQAGVLIRVPGESQASRRSAGQAVAEFSALQQRSGQPVLATPVNSSSNNFREQSAAATSNGGRLALSSSAALGSGAASGDLSGADALAVSALSNENETLKEELDRSSIENNDLKERVAALEERLEVSEALIEMENDRFANVQTGLAAVGQAEDPAPEMAETKVKEPVEPLSILDPIVSTEEPTPSFLSKILGFAPYIGALIVIVLLALMFAMKRRKGSADEDLFDAPLDDDATGVADAGEAPEDPADKMQETTTSMDETASFSSGELGEDDESGFESMDELFAADGDAETDESEDLPEPEMASPPVEELTEAPAALDDVEDEDVEDIDLEAALEDLDDFADLDSFLDEDVEDFDLESGDGLEDVDDSEEALSSDIELDVAEPATAEPMSGDDLSLGDDAAMEFESIELPDSDTDDSVETTQDDANAMDFDLENFDPSAADDEDEDNEPAGNEMEFDSEELELPEVDAEDDSELDIENAMEFDEEIELPEVDEKDEDLGPAGNEMEFDSAALELPEVAGNEGSELDSSNAMEFDVDDLELPEVEETNAQTEADTLDLDGFDEDLGLPSIEDEDAGLDALETDLESDMDELLAGFEDEETDQEQELGGDLDADLDLGEDLLASFDDGDTDFGEEDLDEEMATKLELADAYVEMGDVRGAKELIDEILADGDDSQKTAATKLAERIEGLV